jgi:alkanesulfonate monooxygenase SsuD/methylene tetrahydromethanopterin reductase-like flavin-dependent oxidoreductase (luciferase family)
MTRNNNRPCKLGLILPESENDMGGETPRWNDYVAMAGLAEDIGLDSIWFVDHLLYRGEATQFEQQGVWECWSILAGLAAVTKNVELGSLVTPTTFRNPAVFAKQVDVVEEISGGRLILGLGAGWHGDEYDAFGIPFDYRVSRFEEAFTIIRSLLRDGYVDFEGKYYSARDCVLAPRGPRSSGPHLMVGSIGPRMLGITLPWVDSWNTWLCDERNAADEIPAQRAIVDNRCREVGRDPATLGRSCSIAVDTTGKREIPGNISESTKPLTGSPELIAQEIQAFADEGIDHLQIYLAPSTCQSIEWLAKVVEVLDQ